MFVELIPERSVYIVILNIQYSMYYSLPQNIQLTRSEFNLK